MNRSTTSAPASAPKTVPAPEEETIAVIGLGYVGLPVAVGMARHFDKVIGFDIDEQKVATLQKGRDPSGEVDGGVLEDIDLAFTSAVEDLADATFFIVTVPTPIDENNVPDLSSLRAASRSVGRVLQPGSVVVYESTVYPGVTEEVCGPILEEASGLDQATDFAVGYSPERINPGDEEHTLERIVKVVSGEDEATLDRVAGVYETVVDAGVHRAPSIRVAEAAKVIENAQRDLNIALMNELALIFDRLDLRTKEVLDAANTKWNFLPFHPGLVGGHCIGVDPYYLTTKAEETGYHPQVILAGRRINDNMGRFVAQKTVKLLIQNSVTINEARVGVLGLTFKEDVDDVRNSRVPEVVEELQEHAITPLVHDSMAAPESVERELGLEVNDLVEFKDLDALIYAVPHEAYRHDDVDLPGRVREGGVFIDVKSTCDPAALRDDLTYWSL
ncbi:UDP-N-acetyl-D-galactosamine dehydrogenase [Salinibacter ruber]|uniref:nucleotide sugar dehydrogenase n=1 Tax=Salinibacter ruber TaxID=146919 RepID=UPI002166DB92|nr:nucleotide sugar dehydrogenase [Salinibacter ruber]MCS4161431.1 UDP-N-acetyl-D-galactosamine dehydrogenase [Salinibacter ruber]